MPKIKDGDYTLQVTLDTRGDLGILTSEIPVTLGRSAYERAQERFAAILKSGSAAKIDQARTDFLAAACKRTIEPGADCLIDNASQANNEYYPGPEKLSAVVRWFPESDCLRVTANVTDGYFTTKGSFWHEWDASCVEVFLCPSGVDADITQFFIVPEGPGNAPRIRAIRAAKYPINAKGIAGSWKRTEKGYTIEARIPWSKMKGMKKSYTSIPVEIAIDSKVPGWPVQCRMNASPDCPKSVRGYALLKMRKDVRE